MSGNRLPRRGRGSAALGALAPCVASAVLLCCLQAGCRGGAEGEARAASATVRGTPVEVHTVGRETFAESLDVTANVLPLKQEVIIPRVAGRLEKVHVDEGDRVEAGQEVARIDQRDYRLALREATANLAAARANAELASIAAGSAATTRDRLESLSSKGAVAGSELDKVRDGQRMGEAKQTAAEAQVQLALVGLDAARTKVADTVLRAPWDGVVIKRILDEGSLVGLSPESAAVMVVADLSRMKVQGNIREGDVHSVKRGLRAKVHVDALPDRVFLGEVELVSPMVDARTRTAEIRVVVDNAEGLLEPGMAARIDLGLGEREVVAVPHEALLRSSEGERAEVFVVDGESRARRREVRIGARSGSLVEVVEGLDEGERVVRSNQAGLSDGELLVVPAAE